jgi:DNA-binding NarL/FixJ family response regulator
MPMPIRVLLADDHTIVRDGLRLILEEQNDIAVVGGVDDGMEAVKKVRALLPDVVVMDITMPELNGIEATIQIREISPSTRVVILSVHSSVEHIYHSLRAGALGYLLKESAGREVVAAVRAAYAGCRYLSNKISETLIDSYLREPGASLRSGPLDLLSAREREILQLVAEGHSSSAIAQKLNLSPKTVETYRCRLMEKLGIHDIPGLVKFAINHGLISPE